MVVYILDGILNICDIDCLINIASSEHPLFMGGVYENHD